MSRRRAGKRPHRGGGRWGPRALRVLVATILLAATVLASFAMADVQSDPTGQAQEPGTLTGDGTTDTKYTPVARIDPDAAGWTQVGGAIFPSLEAEKEA